MRAYKVYEKFTEDSDPIHDMGIGLVNNPKLISELINKQLKLKGLPTIHWLTSIETDCKYELYHVMMQINYHPIMIVIVAKDDDPQSGGGLTILSMRDGKHIFGPSFNINECVDAIENLYNNPDDAAKYFKQQQEWLKNRLYADLK